MVNVEDVFNPFPELETERTYLRQLTYDDAEDIFEYASNVEVARNVTWDPHRTIEDTNSFIIFALNRYKNNQVAPWGIVHKEDNKVIGTADYVWWRPEHRVAEIGYVLSPNYWGLGLMPEVVQEIMTFGFEKMNLIRIQAQCFDNNVASERVMQKVGMEYEGTLRKRMFIKNEYRNLKVYALVK
ncbi:GNAT family N-acetyltransferase [Bacillaceae bacterium W0354]